MTARLVKARLDAELIGNVSIRVLPTERPDTWEVQGRGELQLAVLVEMMRREGFELTVGKPQVLTREIDGKVHEPVDRVTVDVPDDYLGVVTAAAGRAQGPHRADRQPRHRLGAARLPGARPRAHRLPHRAAHRDQGHGAAAPRLRLLRALGRRDPRPPQRLAGRRPQRRDPQLLAAVAPGPWPAVRRSGRGGVRGHGHRRERPHRGHGRQPHEGEEADQRPRLVGRQLREADPARRCCRSSRRWSTSPTTSASRSRPATSGSARSSSTRTCGPGRPSGPRPPLAEQ